jgi:hypothetical protein
MSDPDIYRRLAALERWRDEMAAAEVPILGSGTVGRIPQWDATGQTLEDSTLEKTGAGLVTISAPSAYALTLVGGTAWTPTLTPGTSGSYGYSTRVGRYWRIGNIVHIAGRLVIDGATAPTGALSITGLPLTAENTSNIWWNIDFSDLTAVNLSAGYTWASGLIINGASGILLREHGDNVASQTLAAAAMGIGSALAFAGWYAV